jgi:predicted ArsR family transcriptional regulator
MNLNERIYAADQAKLVLDNEAFKQVFEDIKQELTEQWKTSPARDQDGREKLWLMIKLLDKVHLCLQASLDSGKLAAKELEYQNSLSKKVKEWAGLS